jgi:probable HAF family extracellular repeat protein
MSSNATRSFITILTCSAGLPALAAPAPVFAQCQYEVTIIQAPEEPWGTPATRGTALNESGVVIGYFCNYLCDLYTPFRWTAENGFEALPHPPGATSAIPSGVNEAGIICGSSNSDEMRGYIYDHGEWTELPPAPGGLWCTPAAISNGGKVVGKRSIGDGGNPENAFIWTEADGFLDLGTMDSSESAARDVNEVGQVVGFRGILAATDEAFLWEDGKLTFLGPIPGGENSHASAITSDGIILVNGRVTAADGGLFLRGWLWRDGWYESMPVLPGYEHTGAGDMNDRLQAVGKATRSGPWSFRAVLWQDGTLYDLNDLVDLVDADLESGWAITNGGLILANGEIGVGGKDATFLLTPIDPPTGDVDGDCDVDVSDLLCVLDEWGQTDSWADINEDGVVNVFDLLELFAEWTG